MNLFLWGFLCAYVLLGIVGIIAILADIIQEYILELIKKTRGK